jgi:signal peptidase II
MLGGALGNLVDRITKDGHVTDFLLFMLPVGDRVYQWPAFNVADTSIVVGTILLALLLLRSETGQTDPAQVDQGDRGEARASE